jgi:hypothetical protein
LASRWTRKPQKAWRVLLGQSPTKRTGALLKYRLVPLGRYYGTSTLIIPELSAACPRSIKRHYWDGLNLKYKKKAISNTGILRHFISISINLQTAPANTISGLLSMKLMLNPEKQVKI